MLQTLKSNWRLCATAAAVLTILVMWGCWYLWAPAPRKPETNKPAAKQTDGSVVLERAPDAQAKPKQITPPGAKVDRVVSVTVQPRATYVPQAGQPLKKTTEYTGPLPGVFRNSTSASTAVPCPPVTLDMSLLIMPDGTRRVQASSPDGEVIAGLDIPVEDAAPPPAPKLWAAGAVLDPFRRTYGAFVDRDVGFLRLGAQVNQRNEGDFPAQFWIKAGIRF